MKTAIWMGREFYENSSTIMSSMMLEDGRRFDFGDLQRELENAETIMIRPASEAELGQAYTKLRSIRTELRSIRTK